MSELLLHERTALKEFLAEYFNTAELEDVSFDLGISYEDFPRNTHKQFARELLLYCERRSILSCLLIEVFRRRPKAEQQFNDALGRLSPCLSRIKVEIILQKNAELRVTKEHFAEEIAKYIRNIEPGDVSIIATAPNEGQALIGLPEEAAMALFDPSSDLPPWAQDVKEFESLSLENQSNWRSLNTFKGTLQSSEVVASFGDIQIRKTVVTIQV